MLRTAGKLAGAAAGAAASGNPPQAHCRAQRARGSLQLQAKEESAKATLPVSKPSDANEVEGGWLLMEEALAKGESILTPEEIDSALDTILDYSGIQRCHTPGSDSSSEVADQEEVNAQIQAAEAQLRDVQCGSAIIVSEEFGHMVNTLLQDPEVQAVCFKKLRHNPDIQAFLSTTSPGPARLMPSLLPPPARVAISEEHPGVQGEPGTGFFQELAGGLVNLAAAIGGAAAGACDALGRLFAGLGQDIKRMLHQQQQQEGEAGKEGGPAQEEREAA